MLIWKLKLAVASRLWSSKDSSRRPASPGAAEPKPFRGGPRRSGRQERSCRRDPGSGGGGADRGSDRKSCQSLRWVCRKAFGCVDGCTKRIGGPAQPRLHRAQRDPESRRRVGQGEVEVVGEDQNSPLVDRQPTQPAFELIGVRDRGLQIPDAGADIDQRHLDKAPPTVESPHVLA